MLNRIVIMGRLTADPELRRTQSGVSVSSLTVAVDRNFTANGNRETDFIPCVVWRGDAEFVCKYFKRGSLIVVEGSLQCRKWQDKDGSNRYTWEVQSDGVHFGGDKKDTAPSADPVLVEIEDDGELPF